MVQDIRDKNSDPVQTLTSILTYQTSSVSLHTWLEKKVVYQVIEMGLLCFMCY